MKRRILSLMMALMLCLSALPTPVWATESEDTFEVIEQAVETTADAEPDLLSELVGTDIQPDTFESLESADESEIQSDQDTSVDADEAFFPEAGETIADAIPEAPNETDTDIELPTVMDEAYSSSLENSERNADLMSINIVSSNQVKGSDYSAYYAVKLDNIFRGNVKLFSNTDDKFPLGTSLNNSKQYYVNNVISGKQCYIYAQAVYYYLFNDIPYHGGGISEYWKNSRTIFSNQAAVSYDGFINSGVGFGAYLRTTSNKDGSYNGNYGHSMIILSYNRDNISYLEGNADGKGLIRITTRTWSDFNSNQLTGKGRKVSHIVQYNGSVPDTCTLSINPAQSGYTINQGTSCNVTGTITSNRNITNVTASMDGNQYASWNPNSTSVNIQSSQINQGFRGSDLSAGAHTLRITATCSCGITVSADITINVIPNVPKYNLDVNGWLDGFDSGWLQDYGTFDVWINGNLVADNVPDYCADWPAGTQYALTDIQTLGAHTYHGVCEGTQSGTIGTGNVSIRLNFRTNEDIGTGFYAWITNSSNGLQIFNQDDGNVTAKSPGGTSDQLWRFDRLENNFYKITSLKNGYSLDVDSYGTAPGTNVQAYPYGGNSAQTWAVHSQSGAYLIGAKCTECVLDSGAANNNVHMVEELRNANQLFYIQKAPFIAFSPTSLELTQGESKTVSLELGCPPDVHSFCWRIDGAFTSDIVTLSYENGVHTTYGAGSYGIGSASVTVTGKKAGSVHVTFNMLGADGNTLYEKGIDVKVSPKSHTVTFDLNMGLIGGLIGGGSVSPGSKQVFFGSTYGDLPTPVRSDGYVFRGWYMDPDDGDRVTKDTRVATDADHFLYAHWTPKLDTLYFDANGGTVSPTSKTVAMSEPIGTLPIPVRTGYTFVCWYQTSVVNSIDENTRVTEDMGRTITAYWKANQYTVTFNGNGGSVSPASKTVTYDSAYGDMPVPSRSNYIFDGWYTRANGGTKVINSAKVNTAASHGLYAHWKENPTPTPTNTPTPTPTPTNTPTPTPTNTPTPSTPVTGDLNGDRRVSISDFSILSSIIRGNMTDFTSNQAKYGNVDGNMKNGFPILDVRDLSLIGQYLVESIDEFPARASNAHSGKTIHISFQAISNEEGGQPIICVDPGDVFFVAVNYDAKSTGNLNMDYNLLVTFDPSNVIIEENQSAVYDFSAEGAVGKIYSAKYMGMTPVPNKGTLFRIAFRADSNGMTEQQLNAFIASFDLDAEGIAHYNSAGDAAVWYQTLLSNYNQEVHDYVVDKTAIPTSTPTPTNTPIPVPTGKPAPNPNVPQVVIENRSVLAGSEFSVPVLLKNNPGIIGFDFIVSYDEELLELISVDNGDYALTNAPVQSPYVFNWADGTGDNRTDALAGTMNFRVLNDASGTVVLRIAIRDPDNFVNANMETVAFETSDGTITIAEYSPGDVNSDGKVNNRDVILIQRHIAGWSVDFVREAADVNGDEKINNRDVILIQRKIAGWDVAF